MFRKAAVVFLLIGEGPSCAAILSRNILYRLLLQTGTSCRIYYYKQITHNVIRNPSQHSGSYVYRQVLALKSLNCTRTAQCIIVFQVTVTASSQ